MLIPTKSKVRFLRFPSRINVLLSLLSPALSLKIARNLLQITYLPNLVIAVIAKNDKNNYIGLAP